MFCVFELVYRLSETKGSKMFGRHRRPEKRENIKEIFQRKRGKKSESLTIKEAESRWEKDLFQRSRSGENETDKKIFGHVSTGTFRGAPAGSRSVSRRHLDHTTFTGR